MATFEERLIAIEHEHEEFKQEHEELKQRHEELKQKLELHTIAIGALVNFEAIDNRLNTMDNRFDRLEALLGQVIGRLPPQP